VRHPHYYYYHYSLLTTHYSRQTLNIPRKDVSQLFGLWPCCESIRVVRVQVTASLESCCRSQSNDPGVHSKSWTDRRSQLQLQSQPQLLEIFTVVLHAPEVRCLELPIQLMLRICL
jgi:hypothetical protein